jgi:hypothetical protein
MTIDLSNDQLQLLQKINQYAEPNRRTDRLSECMKQFGPHWTCPHTAFIGLQLRAVGFVTTFKDTGQYAQWNITPLGKAALCEVRNMMARPAKEAPVTVPTGTKTKITEWLVVGPEGDISTKLRTHKEATELAEKWAKDEPGTPYHVVAILETYQAKVVIDKV